MEGWSGLRARVAINLAAAASLTFGFLALASLIVIQRAIRSTEEAGLARTATLVASNLLACADDPCRLAVGAGAQASGLTIELHDRAPLTTEVQVIPSRSGKPAHISVERRLGEKTLELEAPLKPTIGRERSALSILLVFLFLNAAALVLLGTFLLDRGVVGRLSSITANMTRIERFELDAPFLVSEGGDELGRMGGTLNRIRERLREDKQRTTAYIGELESRNKELKETREGLARTERLATVGRLAAGVAHEIGNPVAAILGYLEILRTSQSASVPEYVERINREAQRVDRIVRDLLDFARPQPLVIGPVSLKGVVDNALRLVQPQPRWREMKVSLAIPEDVPTVVAQEHYAVQVVVNLLINAADACNGKGLVTIAARSDENKVTLQVADDGPGIRAEDMNRVFDPFFTTKSPGEGAGLGLSISHRIMESFGGSIQAMSGSSKGAVFELEFRRATPAVSAA